MTKLRVARILAFFVVAVFFSAPGFGLPINVTFDSVAEHPLASTDGDFFDQAFELTNNSGEIWTDFHFNVREATGSFGFIDVAAGGHDGTAYEGPGSYQISDAGRNLDVVGLNIPDGGLYSFSLDTDNFESLGAYTIYGTPSVDGQDGGVVPEPTTMLLVGSGLAGIAAFSRKRAAAKS